MKQLQMIFKTSEGNRSALSLNDVREDLEPTVVKGAMENIAKSELFIKDDVALYDEIMAAQYVSRTVTELFKHKPETKTRN
ncbi:DUF2922 domain-containing protein [Agrilactobacillus yilanensis]|uniref:DUF2922 domain-containing protein n=1 Tax=Agrilactobacillus yilanensis TaxID=2485997 RepID=A0ABW4J505_9LACO|nr:DUF2922 domain-containing protein [Agrilactobacillus yilanensis]